MAAEKKGPAQPARSEAEKSRPRRDSARRVREPVDVPPLADIPRAELTPRVESAVMRLMHELDRLKDELLAAQERAKALEAMADEDPLVPVLNRRGFLRELERTLAFRRRYGEPASLIFLDLDGFKAVNDARGHSAGDAVLRHVGFLLLANVRKSDIVGRIGGDEFALILHRANEAAAGRKAEQLMALAASVPVSHAGARIGIGLSAGVAELRDSDTAAMTMARADAAMYACKAGRKGGPET